jgi:membrane AbrB-like protein
MKDNLTVFLLACIAGSIFYYLHIPLPWMLGPLVTALLWKRLQKKSINWPTPIRNSGLIILGYAMGSPFTVQILGQIRGQLTGIMLSTLGVMIISLLVGWFTSNRTGVGLINGLIGSVPGGLSQMAIICEEIEGADIAVVTLMQITRLLTVVLFVPLVSIYGLGHHANSVIPIVTSMNLDGTLLLFTLVTIASAILAQLVKFPTPYLMGPVFGTIGLILFGYTPPHLSQLVIAFAQITVGIRIGADMQFSGLRNWKSIVAYSFAGVITVIVSSLGIDYLLTKAYPISFLTAFISTAPGGMAEMGITAIAVHADVSLVVAYQLFRLLSMLTLGIPALQFWINRNLVNTI